MIGKNTLFRGRGLSLPRPARDAPGLSSFKTQLPLITP